MEVAKDGSKAYAYFPVIGENSAIVSEELFMTLRNAFGICAQKMNKYLLHSASIVYEGQAYLFSGQSGTGKSTHAKLWEECFNVQQFNGDLNLLEIENDKAYVCGIPWNGTSGIYHNDRIPLGGIIFLRQSLNNTVEQKTPDQMILFLLQRLISPMYTKDLLQQNLSFCEKLFAIIPMWRLNCTKDKKAAKLMKDTIDELR